MGQLHAKEFHADGAPKRFKCVDYDSVGRTVQSSLFQRIADGLELPGGEVRELLYQDRAVACFVPMAAASDLHVLVVPRFRCLSDQEGAGAIPGFSVRQQDSLPPCSQRFIATEADLKADDVALILHMRAVGQHVLDMRSAALATRQRSTIHSRDEQDLDSYGGGAVTTKLKYATAQFSFHRPPYNSVRLGSRRDEQNCSIVHVPDLVAKPR